MRIERFELGSFMTNCYLLVSEDGSEALIIDAPEDMEPVLDRCAAAGLRPRMLVATHGHVDHIAGIAAVKARWPELRVAIHPDDAPKLDSPLRNLSLLMGMMVRSPKADVLLREGDRIALGDEAIEVLHTPGHTPGGITLVARPANGPPVAFAGDTLFCGGIGRTDFPGASERALMRSIREKLLTLPDETICHPGHGPATTIGQERAGNPFLTDL